MSASCTACGQQWERDPRLEVACPTCNAAVGNACAFAAPSGHRRSQAFMGAQPHEEREELAIQRGYLTRECPNNPRAAAQREMFEAP